MSLVARRTPVRERVYTLLLAAPTAQWTVSGVVERLRDDPVSHDAVRPVLYILLRDKLMEEVSGQRGLTVRLTTAGVTALRQILASWVAGDDRPETIT